ncbi:MAG: hypothetical protein LUC35_08325 [Clostridiales bacterium]|nr:hypothetical protein [Clostridiales bacterium]
MNVNLFHVLGFVASLAVTLLLVLLVRRLWLGTWRVRSEYDERQKAAQGTAYRNAFWTVVGYLLLGWVLNLFDVPVSTSPLFLFAGVVLGILVYVVSCIVLDAYMGLNDDPRRWVVVTAVLAAVNLVCALCNAHNSAVWTANLLCGLLLVAVLIAFGVRALLRPNREEDEA